MLGHILVLETELFPIFHNLHRSEYRQLVFFDLGLQELAAIFIKLLEFLVGSTTYIGVTLVGTVMAQVKVSLVELLVVSASPTFNWHGSSTRNL